MALSGWFVALMALGVVPIVLLNDPIVLVGWVVLVLLLAAVDLALAGSPRQLHLHRDVTDRVRLGETTTAELTVVNAGRRTVRGIVRDSWEPSAGATPTRARISVPRSEQHSITTLLKPFRR